MLETWLSSIAAQIVVQPVRRCTSHSPRWEPHFFAEIADPPFSTHFMPHGCRVLVVQVSRNLDSDLHSPCKEGADGPLTIAASLEQSQRFMKQPRRRVVRWVRTVGKNQACFTKYVEELNQAGALGTAYSR